MRYAFVLVPLAALLAAACGGNGSPPTLSPTLSPSPSVGQLSPTSELTPTPQPTPIAEFGPLSQEAPVEGTFIIDLTAGRWVRVLPTYFDPFVAVSPDGDTILYRTQEGLMAVGADGSDPRQIADGQVRQAAFSPDGAVLAIWGREATLTLIPWPDGQPVEVDLPGPVLDAAWSATILAACTAGGTYFVSRDGVALGATDGCPGRQNIFGAGWPPFAWAAHDPRLAFWTSDQDGSILSTVVPGEQPQLLAQLPGERISRVSWSQDGSLLAVVVARPAPPPPDPLPDPHNSFVDVRVIDVASGHTRFIITGAGFVTIAWSPTESLLLFDNLCSQESQLMLVNGDGSDLRPLSEAPDGIPHGQAWSPDGREVATSGVERKAITAVDVESGETRTLIRGPGLVFDLQWVTEDLLVVTTSPGGGFCEGIGGQRTSVVFP